MPPLRDHEIRTAAHATLFAAAHAAEDTAVHDALPVRNARIDIAIVGPNDIHGYEIKSDRDVLDRLLSDRWGGGQIANFGTAFDRLTIITTPRHLTAIEQLVPSWWGIIVATASPPPTDTNTATPTPVPVTFTHHRAAQPNPALDPSEVAGLLQRDELESLFWRHKLRGYSKLSWCDLRDTLAARLTLDDLRADVRRMLRHRPSSPRPLPHEQKKRHPKPWDDLEAHLP